MKTWIISVVLLILLTSAIAQASFEEEGGARLAGLGGAFVALSDDSNAVEVNPGAIWYLPAYKISSTYSREYTGLDYDKLGFMNFSYSNPLGNICTLGVHNGFFNSQLYRENQLGIVVSRGFNDILPLPFPLSLGIDFKVLRKSYRLDDQMQQDPFFIENGSSRTTFALDLGIYTAVTRWLSWGVALHNLNQPNISLDKEAGVDKVPLRLVSGLAGNFRIFKSALDIEFIDQKLAGKKQVFIHWGVETERILPNMSIRGGFNNNQLALGFGYNFKGILGTDLSVDYAFLYPLGDSLKSTYGSHYIGLSFSFWESKVERKLFERVTKLNHFKFDFQGDVIEVTLDTKREFKPEDVNVDYTTAADLQPAYSTFNINAEEQAIYSAFEIQPTLSDEDISNGTVRFRIKKDWLSANSVDPTSIQLRRLNKEKNQVEPLKTSIVGEDATYFYMVSNTPGFSEFIISGDKIPKTSEQTEDTTPPKTVEETTTPTTAKYTIVAGDCLFCIAGYFYHDPFQWPVIYQANTDQISDPHWVFPGQVLIIPPKP
jgi:PGF-pre-PGF domain-containing protein